MRVLLRILTYLSAVFGTLLYIRPEDNSKRTLLWIPKLLAGALSPVLGITGALGALLGLIQRDWKLLGAGILGAGLATKFIADIPNPQDQFTNAFGVDWQARIPASIQASTLASRMSLPTRATGEIEFQRNLVIGEKHNSGKPFLADLWQPQPGIPRSGLGIIYAHGSGWRVGDKDMLTKPFFRRLAGQRHLVLDIAYSLLPEADIPTMVKEVNQAILWIKNNSAILRLNPDRIVLMGGSAGGHLALLTAYTPNHPSFQPTPDSGDTSVRGVVAFYPAVDFWELYHQINHQISGSRSTLDKMADGLFNHIFELPSKPPHHIKDRDTELRNYLVDILGGTPGELPEIYDLLSPIQHVGKNCPPTLLLQGGDDVFGLAPQVRRFHQALQQAGVPVSYVEYPHTEHGFDLVLPQISPVAQAATLQVERFLALLV
jgi:acetyl esterase/lipase